MARATRRFGLQMIAGSRLARAVLLGRCSGEPNPTTADCDANMLIYLFGEDPGSVEARPQMLFMGRWEKEG